MADPVFSLLTSSSRLPFYSQTLRGTETLLTHFDIFLQTVFYEFLIVENEPRIKLLHQEEGAPQS